MTDYETMTIEELEAQNMQLSAERDLILQEQLSLNTVLSRKIAERNAQVALDNMTDEEKEAFENALRG